jgi:hypothetical protein
MLPMFGVIVDMQAQFAGRSGPSVAALALGCCSLWIVLRDWPWRLHHLVGATAGLLAATVTAAIPASPDAFGIDPPRANAFILAYSLVGLGLVCNGFGDHILLRRWLQPVGDANDAPGALAWVGFRRAWCGMCAAAASLAVLALPDTWLGLFPAALMLAFIAGVVVPSLADTLRAARNLGKRPLVAPERGAILRTATAELAAAVAVAVSASVQVILLWPGRPILLALSIVFASGALAMAARARRASHAIRSAAVLVALTVFPVLSPPRAVIALVCALAVAVMVDGLRETRQPA